MCAMNTINSGTGVRHRTAACAPAGKSLFVFGLGYTTVGLCSQAAKLGWCGRWARCGLAYAGGSSLCINESPRRTVAGTTRSLDRADVLSRKGCRIHRYEPASGHSLR
jgi:hypothetical protein